MKVADAHDVTADILSALGYAVLLRRADGRFDVHGAGPEWFDLAFPGTLGAPIDVANASDFLDTFLLEATEWWDGPQDGALSSGVFYEPTAPGADQALEAKALSAGGRDVLLLGPPAISYDTSSAWLGLVRESEMSAERERRRVMEREVLLHTIVHDLSNPLAGIRGSLRLMLETPDLCEESAELAEIATRSAERMRSMIASILHTFRDEVAPLLPTTQGEKADAAAAARYVIECFQARAVVDKVHLSMDAPQTVLPVVAEQGRLERVLLNLVDNAFRHVYEGGSIRIRAERDDEGVLLEVADDGQGVAPEAVGTLFQSFEQRGGVAGRVGLGLYSCRIAAEGWGGTIAYAPNPTGGACFRIRLVPGS